MNSDSQFRLQTVLTVREYQERRLQHDLFKIGQDKERENSVLTQLNDEIELAVIEDSAIVRVRATELQTSKAFIDTLSNKITDQEQVIGDLKHKEKHARGELVNKRQSRHMLESLKKTHEEKVQKEEDEKVQKIIDEFGNRERKKIGE